MSDVSGLNLGLTPTRNCMIGTTRDINSYSEDCIPFNQLEPTHSADTETQAMMMVADDRGGGGGGGGQVSDRGNGTRPGAGQWTTSYRNPSCGSRMRTCLSTSRWLICVLLLLLLLIVFIALWAVQRRQLLAQPCLDPTCINVASDILSNMDLSVSPCDNFYEYACNGWIRNNHIPPGHNNWAILRKLTKNGEYYAKDLLENQTIPNPSRALKLAQVYYNACMNETAINNRGFEPLFSHIVEFFGGWVLLPNSSEASRRPDATPLEVGKFNLTELFLQSVLRTGNSPLFRLGVGQDLRNSSRFLIDLSEGVLSLHREKFVNETYPAYKKQNRAYQNFMGNYSEMLGVPADRVGEMAQVYAFQKEIAERMEDRSERDTEKNFELTTIADLQKNCPVLDWHLLITATFEPLNYTVKSDEVIALTDMKFLISRCKLYEEYLKTDGGIRILHNVAVWHFLWSTVSKMPSLVSHALEEFREAEFGFKIDPARWQTCVTETQVPFGMVISRIFVREKFDQKSKNAATEMISEIREAFKENFASVTWMEEEDKIKAIEKVDAMKASVGYPSNIDDLDEEEKMYASIKDMYVDKYLENSLVGTRNVFLEHLSLLITKDKDKWELSPHIVNAFYKENANHIYFPAGILQSPVYDNDHPMSLNFGGIGMVVGHEITHAFDHQGAKRDAKGNLRQWWSNKTREAFEHNAQCMVDQYSNYSVLNTSLNGVMTLSENIADNGGIKAAYKAFKLLESKYGDKPVLPGLNLTPDQLFYISFAQIWCVKHLPQSILNTVLFDVHTLDQYRVIGTLSNSQDFAKVFNCPVGSTMNPAKKCVVW